MLIPSDSGFYLLIRALSRMELGAGNDADEEEFAEKKPIVILFDIVDSCVLYNV